MTQPRYEIATILHDSDAFGRWERIDEKRDFVAKALLPQEPLTGDNRSEVLRALFSGHLLNH